MAIDVASLDLFRRQYLQLVEPDHLAWPSLQHLRVPDAQTWIYDHMFSNCLSYPPPERYQLRVLKQLVARIEAAIVDPDEDEISDALMSRLSFFISSKLPSDAELALQRSYVTYFYTSTDDHEVAKYKSVTLLEARSVLSASGTTGLRTWEAALHLGLFLTTPAGLKFIGKRRVLELGAGTGFLSILCTKHLGAARVTATDGDPGVIESLGKNVSLNILNGECRIRAEVLLWGQKFGTKVEEEMNEHPYDVVLGADLTYDKEVVPSLVSSICDLIWHMPFLDVIIAATVRNEDTIDAFTSCLNSKGFAVDNIEFCLAPENRVRGFFYSIDVPIRIMYIRKL